MEAVFAVVVGIFFTAAIYLMLSRYSIRIMLGIAILGNAVNLCCSRPVGSRPKCRRSFRKARPRSILPPPTAAAGLDPDGDCHLLLVPGFSARPDLSGLPSLEDRQHRRDAAR